MSRIWTVTEAPPSEVHRSVLGVMVIPGVSLSELVTETFGISDTGFRAK